MNCLISEKQLNEYLLNIKVCQYDYLNALNVFDQTKVFEIIEIFKA